MDNKPIFKVGPRSRFRDQEFWAEGGMICMENRDSGAFKVITRAEAAARAIALNQELKHMTYADERDELCKCVVELCEAVKEAKRQGDPANPEVMQAKLKDLHKVSMYVHDGGVLLSADSEPKPEKKKIVTEDEIKPMKTKRRIEL